MRSALFGLLGLVSGAALGLLTAFVVAWLWPAAGLPMPDEPKAALALMTRTGMVTIPLGALAGAIWFVRQERAGRGRSLSVLLPTGLGALVIAWLFAVIVGS